MYPFWKHFPAKLGHDLAPLGIQIYSELFGGETPKWKPFSWKNLSFQNRLGIAGGVDKNGDCIQAWIGCGAGFLEVGTITPLPQKANSGMIIDRDWENKNLWNKMGFPNVGARELSYQLMLNQDESKKVPMFLNIGKNRSTKNSEASSDYLACVKILNDFADAFVINISSPNTAGLRELQNQESMRQLLQPLRESTSKPMFVKLSPDLTTEDLDSAVRTALDCQIDGFILTNTTSHRPNNCLFPAEGGLSGQGLAEKSVSCLKQVTAALKEQLGTQRREKLIVSVGGILTPQDIERRLELGADLVQTYSALAFSGPRFFNDVATYMNNQAEGNP